VRKNSVRLPPAGTEKGAMAELDRCVAAAFYKALPRSVGAVTVDGNMTCRSSSAMKSLGVMQMQLLNIDTFMPVTH